MIYLPLHLRFEYCKVVVGMENERMTVWKRINIIVRINLELM